MTKDLNELRNIIHKANAKWWQDINTQQPIKRNAYELLALVISELSECLEGERKDLMDDKLPHRKMAEVELADAKIRLLDYAGGFNIYLLDYHAEMQMPENKAHGLFIIMASVTDMDGNNGEHSVSHALNLIESYASKWGYDIHSAMEEKLAYNATREDHTHEARKIAGGKQF